MTRYRTVILWLGWALALVAALSACHHTPSEQALRDTIAGFEQAIEKRDSAGLRDVLSEDFIGPDGLDRDGARRMAQVLFLRNRNVGMGLGPLDVAVQGDHATVHCTAVATGSSGGLLPDSGRIYDVTTGWRREKEDWRLTSIEWASQ